VTGVSASLLNSPVSIELVNGQTGTRLDYTESTVGTASYTFEVKLKLDQALLEANTPLCLKLLAQPDTLLEHKTTAQQLKARPGQPLNIPLPSSPLLPPGLSLTVKATKKPVGIRPILCGETATTVAVGAGYDQCDIAAAFPDIQLGCGVKGGTEAAFHDVVMGLESGLAVADMDFENAFGLRTSKHCFLAMSRIPQLAPLLRPFHALYRFPAPIFVADGKGNILFRHVNSSGPRQGCILGSVAFCASVQANYVQTRDQAPGSRAVAIIDNFTLVGPIAALKPAAEHLLKHAADGGGRLRREKCKLHHDGSKPDSEAQWARDLGFKVNTGVDKYLGGFIGGTTAQQQDKAQRLVEGIASDLRKLDNPHIPVQIALVLALSSIPDRFFYLARLNRPEVLREPAKYLDAQLLGFYCKLTGIQEAELGPAMRAQLYAPRRLGGRGIRSCEAMLERAYLGSQALCADHLLPLTAAEPPASQRLQATHTALKRIKASISEERADELLPAAASSFLPYFARNPDGADRDTDRRKEARQLQEELNTAQQLHADQLRAKEAKSAQQRALRHVNQAPGASLVFTTLPNRRDLGIPNPAMAINERLHLGLPPQRGMPLHCHCNHPNGQYGSDPWHALSCVSELAGNRTALHDEIKYGLARWATRLGARVEVEPRADGRPRDQRRRRRRRRGRDPPPPPPPLAPEAKLQAEAAEPGNKRFDLLIWGLGAPVAVDVRVTHSLAPSHVDKCAEEAEAVVLAAEAEKARDYRDLAEKMGAKFFAFAVETTGRLGPQALELIRYLIQEGARYKNIVAPKEVVQGIYRTVAVAIARGNADIVQSNLARSRLAAW